MAMMLHMQQVFGSDGGESDLAYGAFISVVREKKPLQVL